MNQLRAIQYQYSALYSEIVQIDLNRALGCLLCNRWSLLMCKLVIGMVSAYDIYLTVKYVNSLGSYELNPIGRWLMSLDDGPDCELRQVAGFIAAKFAGNFIALSVLEFLASWKRTVATAVAMPLALFQLSLLYFLIFATD